MRDEATEFHLKGMTFKLVEKMPLEQIDFDAAEANRARLHIAKDLDRIVDYAEAYEAGAPFPPLVAADIGEGKHRLLTGLHRGLALRLSKIEPKVHDVYLVVEPDRLKLEMLEYSLNTIVGSAPSRREKLSFIALLIEQHPEAKLDLRFAAKRFQVPYTALMEFLREQRGSRRAHDHGVGLIYDDARIIPPTLRKELNPIRDSGVFRRTIEVVHQCRLKGDPAIKLIKAVKDAPSDVKAHEVLDLELQAFAAGERAGKPLKRRDSAIPTEFMGIIRKVHRYTQAPFNGDVSKLHFASLKDVMLPRDLKMMEAVADLIDAAIEDVKRIISESEKAKSWSSTKTGAATSEGISAP
jgi:hypothetical protein